MAVVRQAPLSVLWPIYANFSIGAPSGTSYRCLRRIAYVHLIQRVKRDRVLPEEELFYLTHALNVEQSVFGPLIRFLLLTGQCRGEVAGMSWSELRDLQSQNALWEIPGQRAKDKQSHLVPLPTDAQRLLLHLLRVSDLVFTTNGQTPVSGFGKVKVRLDARIHVMRRNNGLEPQVPWTFSRRRMSTLPSASMPCT
jgi:integrase